MTAALAKPGDQVVEDHGQLTLKALLTHDGISIAVFYGPNRSDVLTRPFPGRIEAARIWWAEIRDAADAGMHVRDIEARMQALVAAAEAATSTRIGGDA